MQSRKAVRQSTIRNAHGGVEVEVPVLTIGVP